MQIGALYFSVNCSPEQRFLFYVEKNLLFYRTLARDPVKKTYSYWMAVMFLKPLEIERFSTYLNKKKRVVNAQQIYDELKEKQI